LSIVATYADAGTVGKFVTVNGLTGTARLRFYDFLPPPNVAVATSVTHRGKLWLRSCDTRILIR
jgi:hypothetical protein